MDKKVRVKPATRKIVAFAALPTGAIFWGLDMSSKRQMKKISNSWAREHFGPQSDNYSNWYSYISSESVEID